MFDDEHYFISILSLIIYNIVNYFKLLNKLIMSNHQAHFPKNTLQIVFNNWLKTDARNLNTPNNVSARLEKLKWFLIEKDLTLGEKFFMTSGLMPALLKKCSLEGKPWEHLTTLEHILKKGIDLTCSDLEGIAFSRELINLLVKYIPAVLTEYFLTRKPELEQIVGHQPEILKVLLSFRIFTPTEEHLMWATRGQLECLKLVANYQPATLVVKVTPVAKAPQYATRPRN